MIFVIIVSEEIIIIIKARALNNVKTLLHLKDFYYAPSTEQCEGEHIVVWVPYYN